MKNKIHGLFALSVLALVFLVSLASAAITFNETSKSLTVTQGDSGSFTFKVFNSNATDSVTNLSSTLSALTGTNGTIASSNRVLSTLPASILNNSDSSDITLTVSVPITQATGSYTGTISISGNETSGGAPVATVTPLTYTVNVVDAPGLPFCELGAKNASDLEFAKVRISNEGEGKDNEWLALDTVTVEVKFENNRLENDENNLENVIFRLGLLDSTGKDVAEDLQWISDGENEVDVGDIDAKEDYTHVFEFKINPDDVDSGNYKLVVKAYPDGDESITCLDSSSELASTYYENIKIEKETDKDKMVVVDTNAITQPITAQCGEKVILTADVWNIGGADFANKIKVTLFNAALGLNAENVIDRDFDAGDNAKVAFTFDIPRNAEEKTHTLSLRTYYSYDEDDQVYDRVSDETFEVLLKVSGSCVYATADTTEVTVDLESGGKAGQPLVITATVENVGSKTVNYVFNVAGYSAWAELEEITPVNVTLAAGESQEVSITLNVDRDAKGAKTFDFETYSNGYLVTKQPLSADIAGGFSLDSITGGAILGDGSLVPLIIGIATVILVVIIVVVIVKIAKK